MGRTQDLDDLKLRNFKWVGSKYYDYPDGEDLFGKLKFTTTIAGMAGIIVGTYSVSKEPFINNSLKAKILQTARFFIPAVAMAATFTITTYYSTRLRKKDDELNYVLGGMASGALVGVYTPYAYLTFPSAVVFAVVAYVKKWHQLRGQLVFPDIHRRQLPTYLERKAYTSLVPDGKGNWTRDP